MRSLLEYGFNKVISKCSIIIRPINTDDPKNDSSPSQPNASDSAKDTGNDQNLVDALQSVDPSSPEAPSNATSIDDNNGGRIELDEDPPIKK